MPYQGEPKVFWVGGAMKHENFSNENNIQGFVSKIYHLPYPVI